MLLGELLKKTDITYIGASMDTEVHGVSYDTRTLRSGDLFVAVRGYESDGHQYIEQAVSKGAKCILCEEAPGVPAPYILTNDTRKSLAAVSSAWFGYPAEKLKVIGVTGTNGKTTVTNIIKHIIEKCTGKKVGLIGTNSNMLGDVEYNASLTTPESYEIHKLLALMVKEGCEYAVMEVSSHALHMDRVYGIVFEVGVFTNLSTEHLDFHITMEKYAEAKALLFSICRSAAINIDDEYAHYMTEKINYPVITYAVKDGSADLVAKDIKLNSNRIDFCALTMSSINRIELHIPGMFSVYNALAAISAGMLLGFDVGEFAEFLKTCSGVKGRAEVVPAECDFTVLIDYAHTPNALENIIKSARGFAKGKVVTLFGCGGDRDRSKRPLMGEIAAGLSDFVVVTTDNPRTELPSAIIDDIMEGIKKSKTPYRRIDNRREAIYWALENSQPGDVLILAGKGHETYQIIGHEKIHFDERVVVSEFFARENKRKRD